MSETTIAQKTAHRRIQDFERHFGPEALHLAYHAALPVVLDVGLVHLIRINFLFDSSELSYISESSLLLSPLCREISEGLYEMDPDVRDLLLQELVTGCGHERLREIAALLWHYGERYAPWRDQIRLERAQQLTALNFLDADRAQHWLEEADQSARFPIGEDQSWFIAMREEITRHRSVSLRPVFRIDQVLGQPLDVVNEQLGTPWSTDRNDYRVLNEYQVEKLVVQIEFHENRADFISVNLTAYKISDDIQALSFIGLSLPDRDPDITSSDLQLKRWEPYGSFGRLTIYYQEDRRRISHISIATSEALEISRHEAEPESRPRVLVVDDESDWRRLMVEILEDEYAVNATATYEGALKLLRAQDQPFHAAVLDDMWDPSETGFSTLMRLIETIRAVGANTQIVVLTTFPPDHPTSRDLLRREVFDVVDKTAFDYKIFRETIRRAVTEAERGKQHEQSVFVQMSFAPNYQAVYENVIKPTVESQGFTCQRADEISATGPIVDKVLEAIRQARFIITDLTGRNPNVMYELGFAHGIGKTVVLLSQNVEDVSPWLRDHRLIIYDYNVEGSETLRQSLNKTLQSLQNDQYDPEPVFVTDYETEPYLCFLAIPFDNREQTVHKNVEGTLRESGFHCVSIEDEFSPDFTLNRIWEYVNRANVTVADLSGRDASVSYIIGLSRALGKNVVLLVQSKNMVGTPSYVGDHRTIVYTDFGYEERVKLREILMNIADAAPDWKSLPADKNITRARVMDLRRTPDGLVIATPENLKDLLSLPEPPERVWWERAEMEFCLVPASEFLMGSDDSDRDAGDDEKPQHRVDLDAYYIGRYPVTNEQYARLVQDTGYKTPWNWGKNQKKKDYPVVNVSWGDARAYCEWAGLRLLTEAEWEKAASWDAKAGRKRIYPWGDKWDANRCNTSEGGKNGTTPVGAYSPAGDSPYGGADMAGNVWEWVADWYDEGYYKVSPDRNPLGPDSGDRRALRGGSWDYYRYWARSASRKWDNPGLFNFIRGFRCCLPFTFSL